MSAEERDTIMLASAKANLQRMSYFGLTELQEISQYMFEETFNLKYNHFLDLSLKSFQFIPLILRILIFYIHLFFDHSILKFC